MGGSVAEWLASWTQAIVLTGRFISLYCQHTHTHTHPFNGPFSGTTWVSRYQKGKTNLEFTEARDSEWQWHQLGHMQVCTSLQTDHHARTPLLSFLQAVYPSCRPTNSVKALKANAWNTRCAIATMFPLQMHTTHGTYCMHFHKLKMFSMAHHL